MRSTILPALVLALVACSRDGGPSPAATATAAPAPVVFDAVSGADPAVAAGAARPEAPTDTAVAVARLAKLGPPVPACGVIYGIQSMDFAVIDVERGVVPAKPTLSIAVGCPEMPPGGAIETFDVGASYRLRLSQRYPARVRGPAIDRADYWLEHIEPAR